MSFEKLVRAKPPWGFYSAEYLDSDNNLIDLTGNGRNATTSGVTQQKLGGNGATNPIWYISGGTTHTVFWPNGSIPASGYTMCSLTRYTDATQQRILTATGGFNWLHGHWSNHVGVAFYNGWVTGYVGVPTNTDWLSMCGTSSKYFVTQSGTPPIGTESAGTSTAGRMAINSGWPNEASQFSFSLLIIWDQVLTNDEVNIVNDQFKDYLSTGNAIPTPFRGFLYKGVASMLQSSQQRTMVLYGKSSENANTGTVRFTKSFSSAPAVIANLDISNSARTTNKAFVLQTNGVTTSSFNYSKTFNITRAAGGEPFYWVAIGPTDQSGLPATYTTLNSYNSVVTPSSANETIIQYGKCPGGFSSGDVTFTTPFAEAPSVVGNVIRNSDDTYKSFVLNVYSVSATKFTYIKYYNGGGGEAVSEPFYWMAVGKSVSPSAPTFTFGGTISSLVRTPNRAMSKILYGKTAGGVSIGTVTFSTEFKSVPHVVGTVLAFTSATYASYILQIYGVSTTQFSYRKHWNSNGEATGEAFDWVAIGT